MKNGGNMENTKTQIKSLQLAIKSYNKMMETRQCLCAIENRWCVCDFLQIWKKVLSVWSVYKGADIMKTFAVSDHFDHANIIKLANRQFSDVNEMNNKIIENWNSVV